MENYNKRWIAILYYFLDHKDIANGDKIALSVGVSSRTIRNDIKELKTLLVQYVAEIVSEIEMCIRDRYEAESSAYFYNNGSCHH